MISQAIGVKIAAYEFSNLSPGVTSVPSSIDASNQPIMKFPSKQE
jgi:hypothetical protein